MPKPSNPKIKANINISGDVSGNLRTIVTEISRPEARNPKLVAIRYFLTGHRTEGKTWLEHGCIVFSQYYDTAHSIGAELAKLLPAETVGVYAGTGKSGFFFTAQISPPWNAKISKPL